MKRNTGFVLIAAMALSVALLLIPTTQAERSSKRNVICAATQPILLMEMIWGISSG